MPVSKFMSNGRSATVGTCSLFRVMTALAMLETLKSLIVWVLIAKSYSQDQSLLNVLGITISRREVLLVKQETIRTYRCRNHKHTTRQPENQFAAAASLCSKVLVHVSDKPPNDLVIYNHRKVDVHMLPIVIKFSSFDRRLTSIVDNLLHAIANFTINSFKHLHHNIVI